MTALPSRTGTGPSTPDLQGVKGAIRALHYGTTTPEGTTTRFDQLRDITGLVNDVLVELPDSGAVAAPERTAESTAERAAAKRKAPSSNSNGPETRRRKTPACLPPLPPLDDVSELDLCTTETQPNTRATISVLARFPVLLATLKPGHGPLLLGAVTNCGDEALIGFMRERRGVVLNHSKDGAYCSSDDAITVIVSLCACWVSMHWFLILHRMYYTLPLRSVSRPMMRAVWPIT